MAEEVIVQAESMSKPETQTTPGDYFLEFASQLNSYSEYKYVWPNTVERLAFGRFDGRRQGSSYLRVISVRWVGVESEPSYDKKQAFRLGKSTGGWGFEFGQDVFELLSHHKYLIIPNYDASPPELIASDGTRISIPESWLKQRQQTEEAVNFKIGSKIVVPIRVRKRQETLLWGALFFESRQCNLDEEVQDWDAFARLADALCEYIPFNAEYIELRYRLDRTAHAVTQIACVAIVLFCVMAFVAPAWATGSAALFLSSFYLAVNVYLMDGLDVDFRGNTASLRRSRLRIVTAVSAAIGGLMFAIQVLRPLFN
jgi:hypothetical protein